MCHWIISIHLMHFVTALQDWDKDFILTQLPFWKPVLESGRCSKFLGGTAPFLLATKPGSRQECHPSRCAAPEQAGGRLSGFHVAGPASPLFTAGFRAGGFISSIWPLVRFSSGLHSTRLPHPSPIFLKVERFVSDLHFSPRAYSYLPKFHITMVTINGP